MIHVVMMATPEIDWYSKASRANWAKYCHRHGYKYSVIDKIIIEDMHLNWSRIRMALDVLSDPSAEWVFVVDESGEFATKKEIRIGRQNPKYYEVIEGLEPGEQVIVSSYDNFGDVDKLMLK